MNLTFKQILTRDKSIIIDIKIASHITDIPIDIFIKEYKIKLTLAHSVAVGINSAFLKCSKT